MDDEFELPVLYKGSEQLLPARLQRSAYSYRILVTIQEIEIAFEPDEERTYRALVAPEQLHLVQKIDPRLIEAIVASITTVLH